MLESAAGAGVEVSGITLAWFPKELHPNRRTHFHAKAKAYRDARGYACLIAGTVDGPAYEGNIPLWMTFCPPTAAKRDLDNCLAACKAYLDGVAEAWGVDDSRFRPITIDFGAKVKGGCVTIEVLA